MKGIILLEALLAATLGTLLVAVFLAENLTAARTLNRSRLPNNDYQFTCEHTPAGSTGSCTRGDQRYGVLIP